MTKPGVRIALWAAAAVAVSAVAAVAVSASAGATGRPLSAADVARALDGETATAGVSSEPSANFGGTPTPGTSDLAGSELLTGPPGSVVAKCENGLATLENWTPNPGYRPDDAVRGPAVSVTVWFESDTADDVEVVVTCGGGPVPGKPFATFNFELDDHGGGHGGNSGPGSGGSGGGSGRDHPEDD